MRRQQPLISVCKPVYYQVFMCVCLCALRCLSDADRQTFKRILPGEGERAPFKRIGGERPACNLLL